ncbi:hypothetical protein H4S08_003717 [Coemansia sp. RSA 1365]|nr:hypothetical protein H4S08_003717 [Coemansia sp. RSA 1365]
MRFRTLTGVQRHKLTNALFVAGVASAIGTVTGTNLLGCPAANRNKRLDNEIQEQTSSACDTRELEGLVERRFFGGKLEPISKPKSS